MKSKLRRERRKSRGILALFNLTSSLLLPSTSLLYILTLHSPLLSPASTLLHGRHACFTSIGFLHLLGPPFQNFDATFYHSPQAHRQG